MSTAYITEYIDLGNHAGQSAPIGMEPAAATQAVTFTGTHGESAALNGKTRFVRIHVDGIACIRFGTAPVAVTTDPRMAANQTEYFAVPQGQSFKISFVTAAA